MKPVTQKQFKSTDLSEMLTTCERFACNTNRTVPWPLVRKEHSLHPIEVWLQWINDEIQLVSSDDDKESICHLFQAALKDYYSVDVWTQYLNYVAANLPSQMEALSEEAIQSCAADCLEGLRVWAVILEWSKTTRDITKTESYFVRMLSYPYESLQVAYEQYTHWHELLHTPVAILFLHNADREGRALRI